MIWTMCQKTFSCASNNIGFEVDPPITENEATEENTKSKNELSNDW